MQIGTMRISKKMSALVGGIALCFWSQQSGVSIEEMQPYINLVMVYIGVQGADDVAGKIKSAKAPKGDG